jgi:hypothetical protein
MVSILSVLLVIYHPNQSRYLHKTRNSITKPNNSITLQTYSTTTFAESFCKINKQNDKTNY